jgi:hypothetical protein
MDVYRNKTPAFCEGFSAYKLLVCLFIQLILCRNPKSKCWLQYMRNKSMMKTSKYFSTEHSEQTLLNCPQVRMV